MAVRLKRAKTFDSYQSEKIVKDFQVLFGKASGGHYQSQMRVEAIQRLVDSDLEFCDSDVKRVLSKGLSLKVQKGLRLYQLMQRLTALVEPIGEDIGPSCRVRLIPFENLTWDTFLDLRFPITPAHLTRATKSRNSGKFKGEDFLSVDEKNLLERLKPYFGGKKKPTLQSLAMNLLNVEENGKGFSERASYNYLIAVREYRKKKTNFSLTFYAVESYGSREIITVRQALADAGRTFVRAINSISSYSAGFAEHIIKPALLSGIKPTFIDPAEAIGRMVESVRANMLDALPPPPNIRQIVKAAFDFDYFPRINLHKNLQR